MSLSYTPSSILNLSTHFTGAQSPSQRNAAARAAIRHRMRSDDTDLKTRSPNGLHPMYFSLHGCGDGSDVEIAERRRVLKDTLGDVFDAVSSYILQMFNRLKLCPSSLL